MFGSLGTGEIAVILIVALIVFGPKKLPQIGRSLGEGIREFKRASRSLVESLDSDEDTADTKEKK